MDRDLGFIGLGRMGSPMARALLRGSAVHRAGYLAPVVSFEESRKSLAVALAVVESIRTGRPVVLNGCR